MSVSAFAVGTPSYSVCSSGFSRFRGEIKGFVEAIDVEISGLSGCARLLIPGLTAHPLLALLSTTTPLCLSTLPCMIRFTIDFRPPQAISTTVALVVEAVFLVPMLTLVNESWQPVSKL